ncbi:MULTISPECIES: ATP-binding protein [Bartonella]|uniref:ATP-binding protein n=1 Tax=Bartonella TaxID=773 RepID=UPI0018DE338F|nr:MULTISPECIES: ATP-binding protein [Bartonella]MBH9993989.1 two-component sensor histidine kinase [Bartonella sp. P0291]MBH9997666.1 two-component sensor histidine kinase [Bartonella sp. M0192]MBH9999826.1 two-component sensor histidine kinase [Bartonella sp. M0191]MBI0008172.1 two-component sensor histidine kinase [Bartonella sp. M0193]MBI0011117.1 two-component sensor histidine kinase [Bartonella sp. M0176]
MAGPINSFGRWLAKKMPKRLYARSLIIIIAPMVLLQSVIAYVFMERHWQMVTERLSTAVVRDISAIIDIIETYPQDDNYNNITRIAQQRMGLNISILPPDPLPPPGPKPFFAILDYFLSEEITRQINRPFWIDTVGDSDLVEIRIRLDNHVLRVFAMRSQAYASNTGIFLSWMIGTALVLLIIAIFFLRNQIKPIQQLATAADSFGRGLPLPEGFEPRGAEEVRRAGTAFLRMRKRIERQIEQRTMMLSGVSHDLRTILTRFKLQLALAKGSFDTAPLEQDIADMQNMLEGYLAFARGEGTENVGELDLSELMKTLQKDAALRERGFVYHIEGSPLVQLKPKAFSRLVSNLVSNSFRYAKNVDVAIVHDDNDLVIIIDDDGPGIPANMREEVFKPFFRLDEARNQDASGTGLGLSIAQDIARSHGGNIVLDDSPTGGLRVIVEIPL